MAFKFWRQCALAVGRRFDLVALPRIDAQVGHQRDVSRIFLAGEQVSDNGLEGYFPLVETHRHEVGVVAEMEEFAARTFGDLAFEERLEVVAVQMVLEGLAARLVAGEQLLFQIRIASGRDERRHPVFGGHDAVDDDARIDDARPLRKHGHLETTFVHRAFLATERMVAAIGPAEDFRTVVAGTVVVGRKL